MYRAATLSSCIAQCDTESPNISEATFSSSAENHTGRKWVLEFELREKERVRDLVLACVLFCPRARAQKEVRAQNPLGNLHK